MYCLVDHQSPFPALSFIPSGVLLCHCRHKVVQVHTSLIEPRKVGERRLQLLLEMVPHGLFRETLMEEPRRVNLLSVKSQNIPDH